MQASPCNAKKDLAEPSLTGPRLSCANRERPNRAEAKST
jgi:hypothetical protein